MPSFSILKRPLTLLVVITLVAVIFWSSVTLQDAFFAGIEYLQFYSEQGPLVSSLVFVGLAALSASLSPFSSVPLVPVALLLWGRPFTFVLLMSGWLIGHVLTYAVGYAVGPPLMKRSKILQRFNEYLEKLSDKTEFLVVLLFRLAMPAEIPGYLLGMIRYPFGKYFLATAIAELPFAAITIFGSEAFVERSPLLFVGWVALGSVFFVAFLLAFRRKLSA